MMAKKEQGLPGGVSLIVLIPVGIGLTYLIDNRVDSAAKFRSFFPQKFFL
jgi:hypothetical protein